MTALSKERIQNKILELGKAGPYYAVSYDPTTGVAAADEGANIAPASCTTNETRALFGPAHTKQYESRDVKVWSFELRVAFDREVTLEKFLTNLADRPPILPMDTVTGQRQVTLNLAGFALLNAHPPQQQPARGTHARVDIEAVLAPK